MRFLLAFTCTALFGAAAPAFAQTANPHAGHGAPAAVTKGATLYDGQVKRVNAEAKRVTLSHGELKAFNMPAMTMGFAVKDAKLLAGIKEGDKVRFALEPAGDQLVVTRIEAVK